MKCGHLKTLVLLIAFKGGKYNTQGEREKGLVSMAWSMNLNNCQVCVSVQKRTGNVTLVLQGKEVGHANLMEGILLKMIRRSVYLDKSQSLKDTGTYNIY